MSDILSRQKLIDGMVLQSQTINSKTTYPKNFQLSLDRYKIKALLPVAVKPEETI